MPAPRLFILSNRLPVTVTIQDDKPVLNLSSGGLISAVNSYLSYASAKGENEFSEKYWLGVPGCSQASWSQADTKPDGNYIYLPVFLTHQVYNPYYNGMSNSV